MKVLEQGQQKRRFTDFYFQRIKADAKTPTNPHAIPRPQNVKGTSRSSEIPFVRTTVPGDEIKDYVRYQAAQKALQDRLNSTSTTEALTTTKNNENSLQHTSTSDTSSSERSLQNTRRFHLTRDLVSQLSPNRSGGIRKQKLYLRPPVATFIEKNSPRFQSEKETFHRSLPIDRIMASANVSCPKSFRDNTSDSQPVLDVHTEKVTTRPFMKPQISSTRRGQSIQDHPSTWDRDSDALADELAALAFEMDPTSIPPSPANVKTQSSDGPVHAVKIVDINQEDNEYVYETYVRVKHSGPNTAEIWSQKRNEIGVLVIDEDEEDLWEMYIHGNDDSDWDEEDPDSNGGFDT